MCVTALKTERPLLDLAQHMLCIIEENVNGPLMSRVPNRGRHRGLPKRRRTPTPCNNSLPTIVIPMKIRCLPQTSLLKKPVLGNTRPWPLLRRSEKKEVKMVLGVDVKLFAAPIHDRPMETLSTVFL